MSLEPSATARCVVAMPARKYHKLLSFRDRVQADCTNVYIAATGHNLWDCLWAMGGKRLLVKCRSPHLPLLTPLFHAQMLSVPSSSIKVAKWPRNVCTSVSNLYYFWRTANDSFPVVRVHMHHLWNSSFTNTTEDHVFNCKRPYYVAAHTLALQLGSLLPHLGGVRAAAAPS